MLAPAACFATDSGPFFAASFSLVAFLLSEDSVDDGDSRSFAYILVA